MRPLVPAEAPGPSSMNETRYQLARLGRGRASGRVWECWQDMPSVPALRKGHGASQERPWCTASLPGAQRFTLALRWAMAPRSTRYIRVNGEPPGGKCLHASRGRRRTVLHPKMVCWGRMAGQHSTRGGGGRVQGCFPPSLSRPCSCSLFAQQGRWEARLAPTWATNEMHSKVGGRQGWRPA